MHYYYRIQNSQGNFRFSKSGKVQGINGGNGKVPFGTVPLKKKLDQTTELTPFKLKPIVKHTFNK